MIVAQSPPDGLPDWHRSMRHYRRMVHRTDVN
jgi:hypothetical protein